MKSRISIDVDAHNNPIIRVDFTESDDLRDKLLGRFLYSANQSFTLKINVVGVGSRGSTYEVAPISDKDVDKHHQLLTDILTNRENTLNGIIDLSQCCEHASPLKKNAPEACS
jgi:hypothetical protein